MHHSLQNAWLFPRLCSQSTWSEKPTPLSDLSRCKNLVWTWVYFDCLYSVTTLLHNTSHSYVRKKYKFSCMNWTWFFPFLFWWNSLHEQSFCIIDFHDFLLFFSVKQTNKANWIFLTVKFLLIKIHGKSLIAVQSHELKWLHTASGSPQILSSLPGSWPWEIWMLSESVWGLQTSEKTHSVFSAE